MQLIQHHQGVNNFRRAAVGVSVATVALMAGGCGSSGSNAAPAVRFCGKELIGPTGAAPVVTDTFTGDSNYDATKFINGSIYLHLVPDCDRGDDLTIAPAGAAQLVRSIPTTDGKTAAVAIKPSASTFVISGTGAKPFTLHVTLPAEALSSPTATP
jgi:hypothetical protein